MIPENVRRARGYFERLKGVAFDLDGTLLYHKNFPQFEEALVRRCAEKRRMAQPEFEAAYRRHKERVSANRLREGWRGKSGKVGSGPSDNLIMSSIVLHSALTEIGVNEAAERSELTQEIFSECYPLLVSAWRPDALELLPHLKDVIPIRIITNSPEKAVLRKFLDPDTTPSHLRWLADHITGNAQKFEVIGTIDEVPTELAVPGFERPIFLHRTHYFEALNGFRARIGAQFADMAMVGDIFELDLALPLALGMYGVLIQTPLTTQFEGAWVANHPRGRFVESLLDLD